MILLNPSEPVLKSTDDESREIMLKTIRFFEEKGKARLKEDDHGRVWYEDFLEFIKKEKIFAKLLTPAEYGDGGTRWDNWRNCEFNEILSFYGLHYWYAWQVSILGLGPVWMSRNETIKKKTAGLLRDGGIFAFGLSEKEHGADLYSTEMKLSPRDDGSYMANGRKYYIGNANRAAIVSTLGKMSDSGDFVFFAVGTQHGRYECVKNIVNSQSFVAEYALNDYPISGEDILSVGRDAWDTALNTVNVGKFNLGWASIGICTHAMYEAIKHASNRRLYNMYVTDFPHIKQLLSDAFTRLIAMKLFAERASDYMRAASREDRRYLLYNPIVKMKVTTQGEQVINLLWDVIAARGFEKDTFFEMAARDIRALPKLEGTVHVNMALIVKFMQNFLFMPAAFPEIGRRDEPADDTFLFNQGPAKGLGKVLFHDFNIAFDSVDLPNANIFKEQTAAFKGLLITATPDEHQRKDIDFLLTLGELFTSVVYAQLIIESSKIRGVSDDLLDQVFDFLVRDFSAYALQLYSKPGSTKDQMEMCMAMIKKPASDPGRFNRVWNEVVHPLKDVYEMAQ